MKKCLGAAAHMRPTNIGAQKKIKKENLSGLFAVDYSCVGGLQSVWEPTNIIPYMQIFMQTPHPSVSELQQGSAT